MVEIAQTAAEAAAPQKPGSADLHFSPKDMEILRILAKQVAELAARPVENEKRELWHALNTLKPVRPLVFCDPENGWNEIILPETLECVNRLARQWEMNLRKEIFWGREMLDDRVIESFFNVSHCYHETGWGMQDTRIGGHDGGSYTWTAPLTDYSRLDELKFSEVVIDKEATRARLELAHSLFDGFLTVRLKSTWWWTLGLTWELIKLRGLEQFMLDMYDNPDGLHRLMGFLRDGHLAKLDFLEKNSLLSLNNDGTYVGSGGFGFSRELPAPGFNAAKVRTCDMWGFSESQETSTVSPSMFEEFIAPYQAPLMERFGLNCYGCCEPLNNRWSIVEKLPRIRRVSVSPWADLADMAAKLGNRYVFSMKPNPAAIATPEINSARIREQLEQAVRTVKGCCLEIVMKDNHTIGRNPENVRQWCRIAKEIAMAQ